MAFNETNTRHEYASLRTRCFSLRYLQTLISRRHAEDTPRLTRAQYSCHKYLRCRRATGRGETLRALPRSTLPRCIILQYTPPARHRLCITARHYFRRRRDRQHIAIVSMRQSHICLQKCAQAYLHYIFILFDFLFSYKAFESEDIRELI